MDEIERAVRSGDAVPYPNKALYDSKLFELALLSPATGDDFAHGIRIYLAEHRLHPNMLKLALFATEADLDREWAHLYESVKQAMNESGMGMAQLNDADVRKAFLGKMLAGWGVVGAAVLGPAGALLASIAAGVFVRSYFNDADKAVAIVECKDRIEVIRSLLRNEGKA